MKNQLKYATSYGEPIRSESNVALFSAKSNIEKVSKTVQHDGVRSSVE